MGGTIFAPEHRPGVPVARRPVLAAFLSALLPGAGQWYAGRARRGLLLLVPGILLVVTGGAYVLTAGRTRLLQLAVQPRVIWALIGLDVLLLLWRLFAVGDAFRLARAGRRRTSRWWTTPVLMTLVVVAVAAPHVVAASYGLEGISLLESVFAPEPVEAAAPEPLEAGRRPPPFPEEDLVPTEVPDPASGPGAGATGPVERSSRNLLFRPGIGDPEAVRIRPDLLRSTPSLGEMLHPEEAAALHQITILLIGGDAGPGRGGMRADSINVATFNTETGKAALFGIPRNLVRFPLPAKFGDAFVDLEKRLTPYAVRKTWTDDDHDGEPDQFRTCHCFPDQINAIYPFTRGWTDTYPDEVDPGAAALRDVLEPILGLHIDFYAVVRMSGFVRLVDALGGVRVYSRGAVDTRVSPAREGEDWIEVHIRPGWNRLNGHEALAYVRERHSTSDYVRMRRQRCLLKAVAARATPTTVLRRFRSIARAVKSSVTTDVPLDLLPTLVGYAAELDFGDIATVGFVPPEYAPERDHRGKPIPDLAAIRREVQEVLHAGADTVFPTGRESECRI